MSSTRSIGFIGLGHMGRPMAQNLLKAGWSLLVYDRDPEKLRSLGHGVQIVDRPADTVEKGGVVFSMVHNDQALRDIVLGEDGLLQKLGPGGIHVSCSTISLMLTQEMDQMYAAAGGAYVAAPVSGRPDLAEIAQLSIFCAGPASARQEIWPFLQKLGNTDRIYDLGDDPRSALAVKLAFNYPIGAAIMAMAGSAALAELFGVPRQKFLSMLLESPLYSGAVFQGYGNMIARDVYTPALFSPENGIKDMLLMEEAASEANFSLPLADLFHSYLAEALAQGWGDEDWAVAARVILKQATSSPTCV